MAVSRTLEKSLDVRTFLVAEQKRKARKRYRFAIEQRFHNGMPDWTPHPPWEVLKRYETREKAEQALAKLRFKPESRTHAFRLVELSEDE